MSLQDTPELRRFLSRVLPGIVIEGVPARSGQRVVYFCQFDASQGADPEWDAWGSVVLKVSEGISPQVIAYIQREIRILGELNSPGYPALRYNEVFPIDPETEEPLRYRLFVTIEERINALPLNELTGHYNTEQAILYLLSDLVRVLRPLWDWHPPLVHRDLKPQNILITAAGDVVVIDLGIVREQGDAGVTHSLADYGPCTPHYASPEQAKNDKRNISFKSDLFSLGVLCYELLAGRNPFADGCDTYQQVFANILALEPPTLAELGLCSDKFSTIVQRMMQKEPYKRHRRIDDLVAELDQLKAE